MTERVVDRRSEVVEPDLSAILEGALELVDVPEGAGITLEGSIAEGFGNAMSDVDFLVVVDHGVSVPTMPAVLFVDGRRTEVRFRPLAEVEADASRAAAFATTGAPIDDATREMLDRNQRLLHSLPQRNAATVAAAKRCIDEPMLAVALQRWFTELSRRAAGCAGIGLALGQPDLALSWSAQALVFAAKRWLAEHGETYVSDKWVAEQLHRVVGGDHLLAEHRAAMAPAALHGGWRSVAEQRLDLAARLTGAAMPRDADGYVAVRRAGVTTWPIGGRVHVIAGSGEVFALGDRAGEVWRSVVFGRSLSEVIARSQVSPEAASDTLALLHGLRLFDIASRGGAPITDRGATMIPVVTERRWMSPLGAVFEAGEGCAVKRMPTGAERFAAAGMALVWANVFAENAREDALGAIASGQWGLFEVSVQRLLRDACRVHAGLFGAFPLPSKEEAYSHLRWLGEVPEDLLAELTEVERAAHFVDEATAREVLDRADRCVLRLREGSAAALLPPSFSSARGWRQTIEVGYDWIRLGAFVDADFPIEEARDLLGSGAVRQTTGSVPVASPLRPV